MSENKSAWLLQHCRDVHSQSGEDGVIAKCLEILPARDRWCVEFGAWDGLHLSNTANLLLNGGYSAVLIEADKTKFEKVRRNYSHHTKVMPVNRCVGFGPGAALDSLL